MSFIPVDDDWRGRNITVRANAMTDRVLRVDPVTSRGQWRVDTFGRGPTAGDSATSVLWTIPTTGPCPSRT